MTFTLRFMTGSRSYKAWLALCWHPSSLGVYHDGDHAVLQTDE